MLNLKPLVARLVDEVLLAIREASLDDLEELLRHPRRASSSRAAPLAFDSILESAAETSRASTPPSLHPTPPARDESNAPVPTTRAAHRSNRRSARSIAPSIPADAPRSTRRPKFTLEPESSVEITDPAALLAATMPPPAAARPRETMPALLQDTSVSNGAASKARASPALREGESLARTSGSVVIRRIKRA
jgi:hypothetical protein